MSEGAAPPERRTASVTELLTAWCAGDESALAQLTPLVHNELHRLARRQMRNERAGHTLQTTAVVNEAYLKLVDLARVRWQDRAHFFAMAARLMRHILVDYARAHATAKRGGEVFSVSLDEAAVVSAESSTDLVALDDALQALAVLDARKGQVVEMRFFGGLTVQETADALGVSPETVMRDWQFARTWLLRELSDRGRRER
jgi:RNA polymerase sigma factor (TIGR02999 family)